MFKRRAFVGPIVHCDDEGEMIVIDRAGIIVEEGKIVDVSIDPHLEEVVADHITVLREGQFLVPGFIDCHIHAVQFPNLGLGYDKTLLDWLEVYTFPLEKKYIDEEFAKRVFDTVVKQGLAVGTTTACYFASLYAKASVILGQKAAALGQRAFIGKINMNIKRKDNYFESTEESIRNTRKFIDDINEIGSSLVKPIITPRFALSCDMDLMTKLGDLAREKGLPIQTHISENLDEIKAVLEKFNDLPTYTAVYDAAGLLTNKTVLAHGVHLTDDELDLIKQRDAAIIHCPSSNTCLHSGLCDIQRITRKGINVGLGTDVAGGQSMCILDTMRSALQVSIHLSMLKSARTPLNYKEVFYMATLGGAKALAIDDRVGNFSVGKEFDALIIDMNKHDGLPHDLCNDLTCEENLQRLIYSGDDRNIHEVYVNGRKVK